ncbi:hypothetical protein AD998_04100 [bacterium 336/3]|nr:hypothetical protein AD998_04100 [bacterium 336/3]
MKKILLILLSTMCLYACQNANTLNNHDYGVSFENLKDKAQAQCLLDYVTQEKLDLKKYQLFDTQKDTILIKVFGKPKGRYKKEDDKQAAEFSIVLLANDLSKNCFNQKIVKIQMGQFAKVKDYLEGVSDGKAGFREYKPQP